MATKTNDLKYELKAGARNNKYRVIFPFVGNKLDIFCHNIDSPGRSVGIAEVYLKGRKYQLAGDRSDEGSVTMSFYNDQNLSLRRLFLKILSSIQEYREPAYLAADEGLFTGLQEAVSETITDVNEVLSQIRYNTENALNFLTNVSNLSYSQQRGLMTGYGVPWYQTDIIIEQLGPDENTESITVLYDAFISSVNNISYTDETGEITQTEITINYSGIGYDYDQELKL